MKYLLIFVTKVNKKVPKLKKIIKNVVYLTKNKEYMSIWDWQHLKQDF